MHVVQCFDGLHLNQDHAIDQQVREALADHHVIVVHPDAALLHNREARSSYARALSLDLFQKRSSERVDHGGSAADHMPRQIIRPVATCVFCVHLYYICIISALIAFLSNGADSWLLKR